MSGQIYEKGGGESKEREKHFLKNFSEEVGR